MRSGAIPSRRLALTAPGAGSNRDLRMFTYVAIGAGLLGMVSFLLMAWSLWARGQRASRAELAAPPPPSPDASSPSAQVPEVPGAAMTDPQMRVQAVEDEPSGTQVLYDQELFADEGASDGTTEETAFLDMGEVDEGEPEPSESMRTQFIDEAELFPVEGTVVLAEPDDAEALAAEIAAEAAGPAEATMISDLGEEFAEDESAPPDEATVMVSEAEVRPAPSPAAHAPAAPIAPPAGRRDGGSDLRPNPLLARGAGPVLRTPAQRAQQPSPSPAPASEDRAAAASDSAPGAWKPPVIPAEAEVAEVHDQEFDELELEDEFDEEFEDEFDEDGDEEDFGDAGLADGEDGESPETVLVHQAELLAIMSDARAKKGE